jgi:uncharacterized membrane protein YbhN (UPF0104 family)
MDRTFDVVVAGLFLVPSVLLIVGVIGPQTGVMLFGIAFVAGLLCFALYGKQTMYVIALIFSFLFKAVCRIPWIGRRIDLETESDLLTHTDSSPAVSSLYLLSGLKFLLTSMRFISIAQAMGIGLGAADILVFVPAAQFAALFALTPGGLGIADWSWSGLLYRLGADKHVIVPYLLSLRLVITLSILLIAGLSRLTYRNPGRSGTGRVDRQGVR